MAVRSINSQSGTSALRTSAPEAVDIIHDTADFKVKYLGSDGNVHKVLTEDLTAAFPVTLTDTAGVNRAIWNPTAKTITNASATTLFNVTRTNNVAAAGVIFYQAFATDGTDLQTIMGMVTYSFVDKAGTGTFTITEVAGNQAKAVSAGTYTLAWTFVTGTGVGIVKLQPTTSLTATIHTVTYTVFPISGAVAIQ